MSFTALVFVEGCLLTQPLQIRDLTLVPLSGPKLLDEVAIVQQTLGRYGIRPLNGMERVVEQARQGSPVFVVIRRGVNGASVEEAGAAVRSDVLLAVDLLAFTRGAAGSIFAEVILDEQTGHLYHKFSVPQYQSNLLGGVVSGEDPRWLTHLFSRADGLALARFHLKLFRQATAEQEVAMRYFRFWSFLEVMAQGLGVTTDLRNWEGQQVDVYEELKSGTPAARVFELLRRSFQEYGFRDEQCFNFGTSKVKISQMVGVWYAYRNAVVHEGSFDPTNPQRKGAALDAYNEVIQRHGKWDRGTDEYLRALRDAAEVVMEWELGGRLPTVPGPATSAG